MGASAQAADPFLSYRRCVPCLHAQAVDSPHCARCGSMRLQNCISQGFGTILSFTTVHRAPNALFRSQAPYIIVLAVMDEGFQRMSNMAVVYEPAIGLRIRLIAGETGLPVAVPA